MWKNFPVSSNSNTPKPLADVFIKNWKMVQYNPEGQIIK